jgi:hypothetical protein
VDAERNRTTPEYEDDATYLIRKQEGDVSQGVGKAKM